MTRRIGILGGTFNPIHNGHLLMAEGILAKLRLDSILFIPCDIPPHKKTLRLISSIHRKKMVQCAIKDNHHFVLSAVELKRRGKSYSIDTLKELAKIYKDKTKLFFIIGSDNLHGFSKWKDPKTLLKLCELVVVKRPNMPLTKHKINGIKTVNVPTLPISSTNIRSLIRRKKSIKYMVPEDVRKYILNHRLYCG